MTYRQDTPLARAIGERDEAREELRQLRVAMAMAMPSRWRGCRLSRSEGALLADLVQRGDQGSRYTRLTLVVRGFTGIDRDRDASLKVTMCRLRGKLALLDPPVRIGTEWGAGYRIDAENLALLAERRI